MGRNSESVAAEKDAIRAVYREIAEEYDERIPGRTPADRRFVETEMAFKRPGVRLPSAPPNNLPSIDRINSVGGWFLLCLETPVSKPF